MSYANNLSTQITAALLAESSQISVGASFAAAVEAAGLPATLTLSQPPGKTEYSWEIVRVTSVTGATMSVERALEGTAQVTWPAGSSISCRLTAGQIARMSPRTKRVDHGYLITPDDDGAVLIGAGTLTLSSGDWQPGARLKVLRATPGFVIVEGDGVSLSAGRDKEPAPEYWHQSIDLVMTETGAWSASGATGNSSTERLLIGSGSDVSVITAGTPVSVATTTGRATAMYSPDGSLIAVCDDDGAVTLIDTASGSTIQTGISSGINFTSQWRSDSEYFLLYSSGVYRVIDRAGAVMPVLISGEAWPVWQGDFILTSLPGSVSRYSVDGSKSASSIPAFRACFSGLANSNVIVRREAQADWAIYSASDELIATVSAAETTCAAVSNDGSMVALQDDKSRIYSMRTGALMYEIDTPAMNYGYGTPAWSADGKRLWFTWQQNPRLRAIDTETWQIAEQINWPEYVGSISTARY